MNFFGKILIPFILFSSCNGCLDWIAEGDSRMIFINNSKDTVFYLWSEVDSIPIDFPDEYKVTHYYELNDSNSYSLNYDPNRIKKEFNCANCIYPGDSSTVYQLGSWDGKMSSNKCIWILIFNIKSYHQYTWDTIKKYQIIDKKIKVCSEDIVRNKWRVVFSDF